MLVNLNVNVPLKSLAHILILAIDSAEDRKPFDRKEVFKNLDVTKVNLLCCQEKKHFLLLTM